MVRELCAVLRSEHKASDVDKILKNADVWWPMISFTRIQLEKEFYFLRINDISGPKYYKRSEWDGVPIAGKSFREYVDGVTRLDRNSARHAQYQMVKGIDNLWTSSSHIAIPGLTMTPIVVL